MKTLRFKLGMSLGVETFRWGGGGGMHVVEV